jgi:hypothetical protein
MNILDAPRDIEYADDSADQFPIDSDAGAAFWWLIHHSAREQNMALMLAHYVDDSGSHQGSPRVVMGGPVFAQKSFFSFHYEWDRVLALHSVKAPVHMKEFGRPNGRLGYLTNDQRRALFHDLIYLIKQNSAWLLTVEVNNLEFQQFFPEPKYKKLFGAPPLAFIWCMVHNCVLVENFSDHLKKMAYVVARSDENTQIMESFSFWKSYEDETDKHIVSSITFSSPQEVSALQAADMVAWANRKKSLGEIFDRGFEPLELLTRTVEGEIKSSAHFHRVVDAESTKKLAKILGDPVREKGKRISLLVPHPKGFKA